MSEEPKPPKTFVSYSHDSKEHKIWVYDLAKKLRENGVEVIFDQWDLGYGDDVPKFMERSVVDADRVLMICTELYVHKADEGVGGVGYEAMVVTGEMVNNLGTSKFIPIIKQNQSTNPQLPRSVRTRKYVDLGNETEFEQNFEELLRDLHKTPLLPKPHLGPNPFTRATSILKGTPKTLPDKTKGTLDFTKVEEILTRGLEIAQAGDLLRWRKLVSGTREYTTNSLFQWRTSLEEIQWNPADLNDEQLKKGRSLYGPIISLALAGLGSGKDKFCNQFSLLEDIIFPRNWNRSGLTLLTDFPFLGGYLYQALHGAMSLYTNQLNTAVPFVRARLDSPFGSSLGQVWKIHEIIGWPKSLGGNSKISWEVLISLYEEWQWLSSIFGDKNEFLRALTAYYMALNINEYCYLLQEGREGELENSTRYNKLSLDIPLHFLRLDADVERGAYRLLMEDIGQVKNIWQSLGISDKKFIQFWDKWIDLCKSWLGEDFTFSHSQIAHAKLGKEIQSKI